MPKRKSASQLTTQITVSFHQQDLSSCPCCGHCRRKSTGTSAYHYHIFFICSMVILFSPVLPTRLLSVYCKSLPNLNPTKAVAGYNGSAPLYQPRFPPVPSLWGDRSGRDNRAHPKIAVMQSTALSPEAVLQWCAGYPPTVFNNLQPLISLLYIIFPYSCSSLRIPSAASR